MYPLMSFEVMVSVKTLGALIALEGSLIMRCWLRIPIHLLLQMCCVAAVVARHHHPGNPMALHADETHWIIWVMNVRHDRSAHVSRSTHRRWERVWSICGAGTKWV